MLRGLVAGEDAAIAGTGGLIVGALSWASRSLQSPAGGRAIEQSCDQGLGHGVGDGGGGHYAAKVMTHGYGRDHQSEQRMILAN